MSMKIDLVINQINNKLLSTKLETDPWAYKFIENIFPNDFYQEIITNLPSKKYYKSRVSVDTRAKQSNYNPERFVFQINQDNLKTLNSDQEKFWYLLIASLCSDKIFNTVMKVFKETLAHRMNNLSQIEKNKLGIKNYKINKKAEIVKDFKKYHLGAHTDNYNKLITFLFYLPKDKSLENLGTAIYKKKINIPVDETAKHQSVESTNNNFTKIKTCKFYPNTLLIFPRTNESFHGVDEINIDSKERDLLLFNYYIYGDK